MLGKLKKIIVEKGGYLGYLGLVLLTVFGLMNVVHNLTYLRPTDGAEWEWDQVAGRFKVVETDLDAETSLQVGDLLISIDDVRMEDPDSFWNYLFESMSIGSKHLYKVERLAGETFEPWVRIRGVKEAKSEFFFFAVTGFIYLIFLFLITSKNVTFGSKGSLITFCLFVFMRFSFRHTDQFSPLDWISLVLTYAGGLLLPSALAGVALNQSINRSKWLPFVQAVHWIPSLVLLGITLFWFLLTAGLASGGLTDEQFETVKGIQGLWGGALIVLSIVLLALVAEIRSSEKNFPFFWAIAWIPFALTLWELDYLFSHIVAGLAPIILPVALLFEWSGRGDLHLGHIGKKVVTYLSVIFVLMLGYFFFLSLVRLLFGTLMSTDAQYIIFGIGIMFAAVSYSPLTHFAAEQLDRLIYGKRFESIRVLSDFGGINRADTNIDDFLHIIFTRIKKAFRLESGAVFKAGDNTKVFKPIALHTETPAFIFEELNPMLHKGEVIRGNQARAYLFDKEKGDPFQPNDYICPIRVAGKLAAVLVLALEGDYRFTPEELRLLKSLLHQCDVLMENMELYQSVHQKAESISQLKEFNENIIESSRIGILTMDEMNRAVSCNSALAELVGTAKDAVLGKTFEELLFSGDVRLQRRVKSGFALEGNFRNGQGEELILKVEKTPLRTKENVVYGTLYLIEDIREKRRFDEQLTQQEKLASIGLLAAGVAHEINTPLTGITSYSQLLVQEPGLNEDQKELLDLIQGQSRRAANIVTELLHFSRKESAPKGPVDLMEVLNQTLRFLSHQIRKHKVGVTVVEPREPAVIEGYPNQIQQVFVNLIVNAMDAMPRGGKLEIGTRTGDDRIEMWFKDTGSGMDARTRSHIFDPFFTTKEVGKGTGLGLSVVFKIMQDHNAALDVKSEPGKGATFSLGFYPRGRGPSSMWTAELGSEKEKKPFMN